MRDKYLAYLETVYALVFTTVIILAFVSIQAYIRAIVLSLVFVLALIAHVVISVDAAVIKTNRLFFILTCLWGIKCVVFTVNEGLHLLVQEAPITIDWIDLFLFLIISLLTALSFLFQYPFWYVKIKRKVFLLIGILALMFSGWVTLQVVFAFIDYTKFR